jgi:pilus assembly protein FimV
MPLNTNKKLPLSQIRKLSAALALALVVPLGAHAASLGKLNVLSSLGQPLRAEIEITAVSAEEAGKLSAKLASADAFSRANVDYNPILSSLSFAVEQRQGRHFIRITSSQPVSDPFVDLLLELSAGDSKLVREYTFLLDPADSKSPRNAQVAPLTPSAPANAPAPAATPAPAMAPAAPAPQAMPAAAPMAAPAPAPAAAAATPAPAPMAPAPAAPAPTMPAPAASAPIPISGEEPAPTIVQRPAPSALAEELIRRQQASPADTPAAASPDAAQQPAAPAGQSASGSMARPAAAPAAGGKAGDYRVKQGDTLAGIAGRNKQASVSLDQMLVALYRANPDAFMGNNINRLRAGKILAIPDQPTASAIDQGQAHGVVVAQAQDFNAYRNKLASQVTGAPARKPGAGGQSGGGKITSRVEERAGSASARDRLELSRANRAKGNAGNAGSAEDKAASERALAEANDRVKELEKNVGDLQKLLELKNKTIADLSTQQKEAAMAKAAPAPAAKPEEKPAASVEAKPEEKPAEPAPMPAPAAPAPAAPAAPMPAPVAAKPVGKPPVQQSFLESLTQNPYILPGVGAVVALLVAGVGVVAVRRRKKKAEEPAAAKTAEPEPAPAAPAAAAAVAEPPASAAEEAPVVAAVPAPAEEAAESQLDPVTEADMYIAYGRDEQAEDILKLALQTQPERQALHAKLLEIYAKRGDVANFNKVAMDLHQLSGGLNEAWVKAASLGLGIDPSNPLYGGTPAPQPEPKPEEQGLEFDLSDFKSAEIQPATMPPVNLGKDIDFDLDLENGAKPDADEPILPAASASASAASLLDGPDDKPSLSLSDLNLDLSGEAPPQPSANLLEEDEESAFETEMTTKLDLAAAYQEIGDKEGARELLEEVMRGGSDAQMARAKDMLSKLS